MKIKLSIALTLICVILLQSCQREISLPTSADETGIPATLLGVTEDRGQSYIDSFVFFGESTTYHLKSRGVLTGGTDTKQVLGNRSGTAMLDGATAKMEVVYPETGELVSVGEALRRKRPEYLLLTFGLNGAVQNVRRGEEYFKSCYLRLINTVREASPSTKIILQSCFPVAKNMDMSNYSVSLETLNEYIVTLNRWTVSLAEEEGLRYLNTCEILTDGDGYLKLEYQAGDGHHLTRAAYIEILYYIRTHGYQ